MSDFLSDNFFDLKPKEPIEFKPHAQTPKLVPGIDSLFAIQKNLITAVNALERLEKALPHNHESAALDSNLKSAYRQINRYLREYGQKGMQTF
ncbi:MAG: hypothetical protein KGL39_28315 [Patescibacteria group bacterium]|nr:hypothetical protein [Patescibacteria group bacterium]